MIECSVALCTEFFFVTCSDSQGRVNKRRLAKASKPAK